MMLGWLLLGLATMCAANGPPPAGKACTDCPNIVLLLTDDQDELIGGWKGPMSQTEATIRPAGVFATEFRIHTPICAPSRSELQSGRYYQNIVSAELTPSSTVSPGAINQLDLAKVWPNAFFTKLRREKGYTTGLFGKCMNGECGVNTEAGFNTKPDMDLHQMGAFDVWFEGTGYQNGKFYDNRAEGCKWPWNSTACHTKTSVGGKWAGRGDGYLTATLGNLTVEWIHEVANGPRPFFVYFAPHAPHAPATPSAWYAENTMCDAIESPRLPNWNYSGVTQTTCSESPPAGDPWWWGATDFHELVSCQPYYTEADAKVVDALARNRCRTLLTVDDAYAAIYQALADTGVMDNTYVFITSDHGYNLGHHMLPQDKFLIYEHSLKIPLVVTGPGIARGGEFDVMATQVDLAPTILGLAGIATPSHMDGKSLVKELVTELDTLDAIPASVLAHRTGLGALNRTATYHCYFDQGPYGTHDSQKHKTKGRHLDDWSNTYIGLTYKGDEGRWKFAVYDPYGKQSGFTTPYMFELFDMDADPYELHNIYNATKAADPTLVQKLSDMTYERYHCAGQDCP